MKRKIHKIGLDTTFNLEVYKTFELTISAGGIDDEGIAFEVEATAEITPYIPAQGPTYNSGGQPAEGGYAIITSLSYQHEPLRIADMSWLISMLPESLIKSWEVNLYEQFQADGGI